MPGALILDDHELIAIALKRIISVQLGLDVVGVAKTADEAYRLFRKHDPELVTADLDLDGQGHGLKIVESIRQSSPKTRILVISGLNAREWAPRAIEVGANGYIHKGDSQIHQALEAVLRGEIYLSPEALKVVVDRSRSPLTGVDTLSNAETLVFDEMGKNHSTQEIAQRLGISASTIDAQSRRIRAKLGIRSLQSLRYAATVWRLTGELPHIPSSS